MNLKNTLRLTKQALKGEAHDYTKGPLSEAVILLAIPMILELGLESVFAVVDMFFVSGLGQNAIATVGLTESVISIVYSIAMGLSVGATAIVSRRTGEKDPDGASHAGAQAIVISVLISLILGVLGYIYAADILKLMGASPEVISEGTAFAQVLLGGCTPIVLLFLINGIFRGVGDAAMAMKSLWFASAVNIVLCPILIHFYGLTGAAYATLLGRSAGVAYQCYHLWKGNGALKLKAKHFGFDLPVVANLFSISWPATLQFIIGSGSWIYLTKLIAETGGTAATAGYQIAFRNFIFFILPAWGLSNAAATLMGQNLGAKQFDRAEESVIVTAKYSGYAMIAVTVFLLVFAGPIVGIFTKEAAVFNHGVEGLRIIATGFIFYGISMVICQALNGAGDTRTPTNLNILCFWVFQIPVAYYLVKHTSIGVAGGLIVIPLSHALLTVLAWHYFKKGNWRNVKV